jgi:hypothetical protein
VASEDALSVQIAEAIRVWSWEGALSCSALAVKGPTGGKLDVPVHLGTVTEVCEVLLQTPESREKIEGMAGDG